MNKSIIRYSKEYETYKSKINDVFKFLLKYNVCGDNKFILNKEDIKGLFTYLIPHSISSIPDNDIIGTIQPIILYNKLNKLYSLSNKYKDSSYILDLSNKSVNIPVKQDCTTEELINELKQQECQQECTDTNCPITCCLSEILTKKRKNLQDKQHLEILKILKKLEIEYKKKCWGNNTSNNKIDILYEQLNRINLELSNYIKDVIIVKRLANFCPQSNTINSHISFIKELEKKINENMSTPIKLSDSNVISMDAKIPSQKELNQFEHCNINCNLTPNLIKKYLETKINNTEISVNNNNYNNNYNNNNNNNLNMAELNYN